MAPPNGELGPGDRLGPYLIVRRLGSGGMGMVYEALEEPLGRSVALKVIAPERTRDAGARGRLSREARAQARLDSPHVVQVFAHGEVDGRLFIACQLVPDGDLSALLRWHGRIPRGFALDVVGQIADGLAEAHRVGLVHRDVKPSNVLLRDRGDAVSAYLTDFGIACPAGETAQEPGAGTPAYMAPELHTGGAPAPASDIYSLGCLLWATLAGRAPYAGTTDYEVVDAHVSAPIPQLAARGPFEREANRILRGAMAKNPGDRYPSAALLRDDLRALAGSQPALAAIGAGVPTRSAAIPLATRVGPGRLRRHTCLVTVVLAILLVVVVAAGLAVAVVATRGGATPGPDATSASALSQEQKATDNTTKSIETDGDLDRLGPGSVSLVHRRGAWRRGIPAIHG